MVFIRCFAVLIALTIWEFLCSSKKFKINKWLHLIPIILSFLLWLPMGEKVPTNITSFILSYLCVIAASIYDIKYREIDPKLYIPLFASVIFVNILLELNIKEIISHLLSLAVAYAFMWLYVKVGEKLNETIGGADVKTILFLSLMYPFDLVFMFLFTVFAATIVLTAIHSLIYKNTKSVPMICSIAFAHIFFSYIYIIIPTLRV